MAVTEAQQATLRAHLAGDYDRYQELWAGLDKDEARSGYAALVAAACFEVVDRLFSSNGSADVVSYVAEMRSRFDRTGDLIDPVAAERIIDFMLGHGSIDDMDDGLRHRTELAVLTAGVTDLNLDDAELGQLMAEARELADEWISEQE